MKLGYIRAGTAAWLQDEGAGTVTTEIGKQPFSPASVAIYTSDEPSQEARCLREQIERQKAHIRNVEGASACFRKELAAEERRCSAMMAQQIETDKRLADVERELLQVKAALAFREQQAARAKCEGGGNSLPSGAPCLGCYEHGRKTEPNPCVGCKETGWKAFRPAAEPVGHVTEGCPECAEKDAKYRKACAEAAEAHEATAKACSDLRDALVKLAGYQCDAANGVTPSRVAELERERDSARQRADHNFNECQKRNAEIARLRPVVEAAERMQSEDRSESLNAAFRTYRGEK